MIGTGVFLFLIPLESKSRGDVKPDNPNGEIKDNIHKNDNVHKKIYIYTKAGLNATKARQLAGTYPTR